MKNDHDMRIACSTCGKPTMEGGFSESDGYSPVYWIPLCPDCSPPDMHMLVSWRNIMWHNAVKTQEGVVAVFGKRKEGEA